MARVAKGRGASRCVDVVAVASGAAEGWGGKNEGKGKPRVDDNADAVDGAAREEVEGIAASQRVRGWDCAEVCAGWAGMLELRVLMLGYRARGGRRRGRRKRQAKGDFRNKGRKKSVKMAMRRVGGGATGVGGV